MARSAEVPRHQRALVRLGYVALGFLALGSFFDAINSAIQLLTPALTLWSSVAIVALWLAAEASIRGRPPLWKLPAGQIARIRELGAKPRLVVLGAVLLLWLPQGVERLRGVPTRPYTPPRSTSTRSIAVLPFVRVGAATAAPASDPGPLFSEYLMTSLTKTPGLTLVERPLIDKVLGELQFNAANRQIMDPSSMQKAGRLLGAEYILTGTYWSDATSSFISARAIEVETGQVWFAVQSRGDSTSYFEVLADLEERISRTIRLAGRVNTILALPLTEGSSRPTASARTSEEAFVIGYGHELNQDYTSAAEAYRKAIDMDGTFWQARFNLALSEYRLGRHEEALREFRYVMMINPRDSDAYVNVGVIHLRLGQYELASTHLTTALELGDTSARVYYNLGLAKSRLGETAEATRLYEACLAANPRYAPALNNLGKIRYDTGDVEGAATYFQQALDIDPVFADSHFNLALVHYKLGRDTDAVQSAARFAELARTDVQRDRGARLLEVLRQTKRE